MRVVVGALAGAFVFLVALLATQPRAQAQEQPPQLVVRSRSSEVLVDVVVTDKNNTLVKKLKREDFTVYEDGIPQPITGFQAVSSTPEVNTQAKQKGTRGPSASPDLTERVNPPFQAARGPSRTEQPINHTMMLLDYSGTEYSRQVWLRRAAKRFIEQRLRPNDRVAVITYDTSVRVLADFTNDRTVLMNALDYGSPAGAGQAVTAQGNPLPGAASAATAGSIAAALSNLPTDASPVNLNTGDANPAGGAGNTNSAARLSELNQPVNRLAGNRDAREILLIIRNLALATRHIEGRKPLILVSSGFVVPPEFEDLMNQTISVAKRADVVIYAIDSRGLDAGMHSADRAGSGIELGQELGIAATDPGSNPSGGGPPLRSHQGMSKFDRVAIAGHDAPEAPLRYMSYQTGGFWVHNTNDFLPGLNRIEEEIHGYYLLTYRPKSTELDGRFRSIRVEVTRRDVTVRARNGYYAVPPALEKLAPQDFQLVLEGRRRALPSEERLFVGAAGFRMSGAGYRVPVMIEAPASGLVFEKTPAGYRAWLQMLGLIRNPDDPDTIVASFAQSGSLTLSENEYKAVQAGSISMMENAYLPAGDFIVETVLKDRTSNAVYRRELPLYLRPPGPALALSTVLLASQLDFSQQQTADNFLRVGTARILPSVERRFSEGDNLIFYFDIYNPSVSQKTQRTDLLLRLRLLREGRPIAVKLPDYRLAEPLGPDAKLTVSRFVQLEELEPGEYSLVVEVSDELNNAVERAHADFRIIP